MPRLNKDELLKFLEVSLKEAIKIKDSFNNALLKEEKLVIAKNFQAEIISFLDYLYTNFPAVLRKEVGDYFPRPRITEDKKEYIKRISSFSNNKKQEVFHLGVVVQFLSTFYDFNKEHDCAISYIKGKVKHEWPGEFNTEKQRNLEIDLFSNMIDPVIIHGDGNMEVKGIGVFAKGTKISNCTFSGGGQFLNINKLNYDEIEITGGMIIFKEKELNFKEWAENCVVICQKTLEILNTINPYST
ncbi:MAG: hypothetical protein US81_C0018G0005 [Parcubacteria group bacterium GW2011_GWE2_38_18]|nr:MAG: hypothetical protein US81_C0018G0005 [Parcubacteria group bacterium GW2011_GWE2_38_18]